MTRRATLLLVLSLLLVLLAAPALAQDAPTGDPATSPVPAAGAEATATAATVEATPLPLPTAVPVRDGALVQAVLYFSPTCGHCHVVITETLPPLFAEHGGTPVVTYDQTRDPQDVSFYLMSNDRLQLLLVDVSIPAGQAMFRADSTRLDIDSAGVPRLDVEDGYLVGSFEIPDQFPSMVADGLAGAGIAWPPIPGLAAALAPFVESGAVPDPEASAVTAASPAPEQTGSPEQTAAASGDPVDDTLAIIPVGDPGGDDWLDKVGRDPVGNGISIVVLLLLGASLIAAPLLAMRGALPAFPGWITVVLVVIGITVAAYLATIETSGSEAVCGPVGDCNAVQQSEYSTLFGLHIGVLGVIGYGLIGVLWVLSRVSRGVMAEWSRVFVALGAVFGVAFSAYLTFLEPFVIGATCMWCISSALVMLALLWVSVAPGWAAWQRIRGARDGGAQATASA